MSIPSSKRETKAARGGAAAPSRGKSMKMGTDELKDLIKSAVKEAMGEDEATEDTPLEGVTSGDILAVVEQAIAAADEKRKARKDAGEEVADLTADEVIEEVATLLSDMTPGEGMGDEPDDELKGDDESGEEKGEGEGDDEEKGEGDDEAKRRKSAQARRRTKAAAAPPSASIPTCSLEGAAQGPPRARRRSPRWSSLPAPLSVWTCLAGMTRTALLSMPKSIMRTARWQGNLRPFLLPAL